MVDGNGRSGLAYVLRDMEDAQRKMDKAQERLACAPFPDFERCPAGGDDFHRSMAEMSHAQNEGMAALLQWQTLQVRREIDRSKYQKPDRDRPDNTPEIRTKWFTARGVSAFTPMVLIVLIVAIAYLYIQGGHQ